MKTDEQQTLGVAEAKRRFSELADRVAAGERFIVARRGKPALALVPVEELDERPEGPPKGALSIVGALADIDWLDEMVEEIYRDRRRAKDRPPPDFG